MKLVYFLAVVGVAAASSQLDHESQIHHPTTLRSGSALNTGDSSKLLSMGKPATSSMIYTQNTAAWGPANAVKDGENIGTQCTWSNHGSVAVAGSSSGGSGVAWWQVDLQQTYKVTEIKIRGMQNLGATYNSNVHMKVCRDSEGADCTQCGSPASTEANQWSTQPCSNHEGQYVRLTIPSTSNNWHFCRVEVYGKGDFKYCDTSQFDWDLQTCISKKDDGIFSKHIKGDTHLDTITTHHWHVITFGTFKVFEDGDLLGYICGCKETIMEFVAGSCKSISESRENLLGNSYCPAEKNGEWPAPFPSKSKILGCYHAHHPGYGWMEKCDITPSFLPMFS